MRDKRYLPIFVNPNMNSSAEVLEDLLLRFDEYGSVLFEMSNKKIPKFSILGSFNQSIEKDNNFTYLDLMNIGKGNKNFLFFSIHSVVRLRALKIKPTILISADLYFAYMATFIISLFTKPRNGIQVSFHGTFQNTSDGTLKAFLRKHYLRFVISRANSLRVVSRELAIELGRGFSLEGKEIVISPIPVATSASKPITARKKIIAFSGRIHFERGLEQWVSIIRGLSDIRDDFSCLVIGDGESFKTFQSNLSTALPVTRVHFLGKLKRSDVLESLEDVKILLSTAPSEGYGVSIREGASAGAFVCAKRTPSLTQLSEEFSSLIFTFDNDSEAVSLLNELLDRRIDHSNVQLFRSQIIKENRINVEILVRSWLT